MQDTTEPLKALYIDLFRRRITVLPTSDEELKRLWDHCNNPVILLQFVARLVSRETLVLATSTCLRLLSGSRLEDLPEGVSAIESAEKWAIGGSTLEQVEVALERAMDVFGQEDEIADESSDPETRAQASQRSDLAYACASVAHLVVCGDIREDLDKAMGYVCAHPWQYHNTEHADIMRSKLMCPTLAQLRSITGMGS